MHSKRIAFCLTNFSLSLSLSEVEHSIRFKQSFFHFSLAFSHLFLWGGIEHSMKRSSPSITMLSHMMMGNWASLRWVELAPSEQMFEVVHYKKGSSFLVFNKQLVPFGIPSFYWRWRCIVNDVNIIVNVLLGIRYFFTHSAFFPIILRVIQLVNMIVNALLGIRYFFTHRALVPILLRVK